MRTIGEMIAELEEDLQRNRAANVELEKWKLLLELAPAEEKPRVLRQMVEHYGFSDLLQVKEQ